MALIDEFNNSIGKILLKGLLLVVDIALFSIVVMFLWNYLAPLLGLMTISYKTSVAIFLLSRFLLKDHLLSPEPVIVHCQHDKEEMEAEETEAAINCLCGNSMLNTDKFCGRCGLKQ
jgi:hypothetical protein